MHMENSLLDNISFVGHLYYYFDGWRNGKTGAISNVAGDFIYRFVEAKRNEKGNLVDVYEHKKDNPIVAVGIVAYWLSFRRNSNPFIQLEVEPSGKRSSLMRFLRAIQKKGINNSKNDTRILPTHGNGIGIMSSMGK